MRAQLIVAIVVVVVAARDAQADRPPGVSPEAWHIAELATATHRQASKENDKAKYLRAHALYEEYLGKNSDDADATLTFFDAELLFKLERYDEAARLYERVFVHAPKGKYFADAAYAFLIATKNAVGADDPRVPDGGTTCNTPGPCAIPPGTQRLLAAFDRYLQVVAAGDQLPAIEYRRARIFYDHHQCERAAPLFDSLIEKHPHDELATYAATLELDCWATLKQRDELRSAIARFKKSPIWNDDKVREQVELVETALKKKP